MPVKDPDSRTLYSMNWSDWLSGEEILTSEWIVPDGITVASQEISANKESTIVYFTGGQENVVYTVTNRITTASRTEDRSMKIPVRAR